MTSTRVTHERQRVFALDTNIFIYHFVTNDAHLKKVREIKESLPRKMD